jgi:hypothetical protein
MKAVIKSLQAARPPSAGGSDVAVVGSCVIETWLC